MRSSETQEARSFFFAGLVVSNILIGSFQPGLAQVVPDNTLGAESPQVVPRDANSDLIEGGAARVTNLFHSFQEFNVEEDLQL